MKIPNITSHQENANQSHNDIPLRMAKTQANEWQGGCGQRGIFTHCCLQCKLIQQHGSFFLKAEDRHAIWSRSPTTGYISKRLDYNTSKRYLHYHDYSSTAYNNQNLKSTKWMDLKIVDYVYTIEKYSIVN